jgi:alpha-D-ribose 1-methylphosphonate 5-triphosphate synthase subunit PhnH
MQAVSHTVSLAGFVAPARDAQATFRALLAAIAEPGSIRQVDPVIEPPAPLGRALAAACLTLLDFETPVWLAPSLGKAAADWLVFHTGAPITTDVGAAAFAVLTETDEIGPLDRFALGSDEAPEGGATLLIQVSGLAEGQGAGWSGPGIETARRVAVPSLDAGFWRERAALVPLFPRGLDIFLCAADRVAALPRTTRVEA